MQDNMGASSAASGFDPSRGVSYLVDVLVALMRECPDEWDDSKRWSDTIRHRPTGIELSFYNFNVTMREPKFLGFGLVNTLRLRLARRRVARSIKNVRRQSELYRLSQKLVSLRGILSSRDSDGSPKGGDGEAAPFTTARAEGIAKREGHNDLNP